MADPAYIRNFKDFTRGELTWAQLHNFLQEAYGGNDRARAIMLSTVTENALDQYVRSKMRGGLNSETRKQLFSFEGIVGTFGAQTLIAYACGWIGAETRHDLDHIRTIRNGFAHSRLPFDFETPICSAVCAHLISPDYEGTLIPHGYLETIPDEMLGAASNRAHPRTRFVLACNTVAERLIAATHPEQHPEIPAP